MHARRRSIYPALTFGVSAARRDRRQCGPRARRAERMRARGRRPEDWDRDLEAVRAGEQAMTAALAADGRIEGLRTARLNRDNR